MKKLILSVLLLAGICSASAQVSIVIDYSYDSSGFFTGANAGRQAYLNSAASYLGSYLSGTSLSSITPGGGNTWTAQTFNPTNVGSTISVTDLTIGANTIVVFAGGSSSLGSGVLGIGGGGGYSASGTPSFNSNLNSRGTGNAMPWGGSVSFDASTSWYFDSDFTTVENFTGQYDFFSVAVHELTHLLGFGAGASWSQHVSGTSFVGANSVAVFGGAIPLAEDYAHWASGTMSTSVGGTTEAAMNPTIATNTRHYLTALDAAALQDIGFSAIPEPSSCAFVAGILAITVGICSRRKIGERANSQS